MPIVGRLVTTRELAQTQRITCSRCKTIQAYVIARRRTWLTLLRIPLFPLSTTYSYGCPQCGNSHALVRQQVKYMCKRASTRYPETEDQSPGH